MCMYTGFCLAAHHNVALVHVCCQIYYLLCWNCVEYIQCGRLWLILICWFSIFNLALHCGNSTGQQVKRTTQAHWPKVKCQNSFVPIQNLPKDHFLC